MISIDPPGPHGRWFPICSRLDVPPRHVFETELFGHELAVWQGVSGQVNVWENRCPHRGMRLTLGANLGGELRCAYHGYRFAEGTGQCTSVPAQPERLPPRSLCTKAYPVHEHSGLIWTRLSGNLEVSQSLPSIEEATLVLYSVSVRSPLEAVAAQLAGYRFLPSAFRQPDTGNVHCTTSSIDDYSFLSVAVEAQLTTEVRLFMQPLDAYTTVVHGIVLGKIAEEQRIATLKHHAQQLTRLRDVCERVATASRGDPREEQGRSG